MGFISKTRVLQTKHQLESYQNPTKMLKLFALLSTVLLIEANPLPEGHWRGYYQHYVPQAHVYHYSHGGGHGFASGYAMPWKPAYCHVPMVAPKMAPETPATKMANVGDVVDVAVGNGAFTTLVKIVGDLGLVDTLKGVEAVTIFAPSDDAFAKLPEGTLESLPPEQAKAIVSRHVVAGATVMAADVATGPVETFGGEKVGLVKTAEGGVQVAYNGQTVNVVTADVEGSNGVIHVIDNVILGGDVVDVAVGAGSFTTLVKIVSNLGLVPTLKGVDSVTIFAPSDAAFAKLPEGTLESLTTEQAKAIVSRHVVPGATVYAADVATGTVGTFGGEDIELIKNDDGVQVSYNGNAVNVVSADVKANNGVIHVIDAVIL